MFDELLYLFLRALEFDGDDPLPLIKEWNATIAHVQEVFDRMTDKNLRLVEERHGRWIAQPPDFDLCGVEYYQCSECGKEQQTPSNYCQFCGAWNEGWKWCVWQDEDNEGVYCTAHIHEDRVLNCPYKNLEERQRAVYPCQDYRPMNGGQDDGT